ncbi:MAG: hypothetical protein WBX25_26865 [Rhodomicrobium sp.]
MAVLKPERVVSSMAPKVVKAGMVQAHIGIRRPVLLRSEGFVKDNIAPCPKPGITAEFDLRWH